MTEEFLLDLSRIIEAKVLQVQHSFFSSLQSGREAVNLKKLSWVNKYDDSISIAPSNSDLSYNINLSHMTLSDTEKKEIYKSKNQFELMKQKNLEMQLKQKIEEDEQI